VNFWCPMVTKSARPFAYCGGLPKSLANLSHRREGNRGA
jgi:hypothetical protein